MLLLLLVIAAVQLSFDGKSIGFKNQLIQLRRVIILMSCMP